MYLLVLVSRILICNLLARELVIQRNKFLGKHRCLGEVLAKSNMFVIMAALLQAFTFSPVPGEEPTEDYNDGVTASPKPFKVLLSLRT